LKKFDKNSLKNKKNNKLTENILVEGVLEGLK